MKQQKLSIDNKAKHQEEYIEFSNITTKFVCDEVRAGESKSVRSLPKHLIVVILESEAFINCNKFVNVTVGAGQVFALRR